MSERTWRIGHTWDGRTLPAASQATVSVHWGAKQVVVSVDSPFHSDAPPSSPPGPTHGLWEYEVVELFVVGADGAYTELELGPHGHHLLLQLASVRNVIASMLPVEFEASRSEGRWSGRALVPRSRFPAQPLSVNAYRIHGAGAERRYLAHAPVPGVQPDFHRLERFAPWISRS